MHIGYPMQHPHGVHLNSELRLVDGLGQWELSEKSDRIDTGVVVDSQRGGFNKKEEKTVILVEEEVPLSAAIVTS